MVAISTNLTAELEGTATRDVAQRYWELCQQSSSPEVFDFLQQVGPLPTAELLAVLRIDQQVRWQQERPRLVETYLQRFPALQADTEAALDLIDSEFLLRQQLGQHPPVEEYVRRFPSLGEQLRRQLELELALREEQVPLPPGGIQPTRSQRATEVEPVDMPRIGKYRLIQQLGRGGQATVYRGVHPLLGLDVAIKVSHRALGPGEKLEQDRLLAEGRLLAQLQHPNVARVYELDLDNGRPYLVCEHIRGPDLERLAHQERLSPQQASRLLAQVAAALAAAHAQGIVHLDLKPGNILVDEAGQPRVIDFGLGRLQQTWSEPAVPGTIQGSIPYMAPEQARGDEEHIGPRTDVFGLGGVLYFLLVGHAPYTGRNLTELLATVQRGAWDRTSLEQAPISPSLKAICAHALAVEPADRPSAMELARLLGRAVQPHRWVGWVAGLALLVGVASGMAWLANLASHDSPPREAVVQPSLPGPLEVKCWQQFRKRFVNLRMSLPLQAGDGVQVQLRVEPGWRGALFLFSSEGELSRLALWSGHSEPVQWRYPPGLGEVATLTGQGTELLLACGRVGRSVGLKDLEGLWRPGEKWPALPKDSLLWLRRDRVIVEQQTRGLGTVQVHPDPEDEVRQRLERLRLQLRQRFAYFEGLAFAHEPASGPER